MSAFAYIDIADVDRQLVDTAACRTEGTAQLIAFVGCPLVGTAMEDGEIQYPFPRAPEIRESLINWFCHWGLSFRVEM